MRRILFFCLILSAVSLLAQAPGNIEQGFRAYGSYENDDFDSVNLSNGSLELHIPILSYPQRGDLNFSFTVRATAKNWRVNPHYLSNGQPNGGNWQYGGNGLYISFDQQISRRLMKATYIDPNAGTKNNQVTVNINTYVGSGGSQHTTPSSSGSLGEPPDRAFDGTGLTFNGTYVFDANGRANGMIDSNGNQITGNSTGWTDSVGRLIPASTDNTNTYGPSFDPVSGIAEPGFVVGVPTSDLSLCPANTSVARIWDVPAPTGTATYYLCYAHFSFGTSFGEPNVSEGGYSSNFLTAIILPNGRSWSFGFDSYGDVNSVTTPGGATITYQYQNNYTQSDYSRWVTSKTVTVPSSGQTFQWTYSWKPTAPSGAFAVVHGPDGNDTAHWMTEFTGGDVRYETKVQYYQGTVSSGTVIKTVSTTYTHNYNPWNDLFTNQLGYSDINVLPQAITTVTSDGRTSQEVRQYDTAGSWTFSNPVTNTSTTTPISYGTLLRSDFYDYGTPNSGTPGPLLRSEVTSYMWQQSGAYLSSNLLTLPYQKTILDGSGVQIAQTTYTYDVAGQLVSSGIATGHGAPPGAVRGNISSVDRWLKGGTDPVTQYWLYDTGEMQQVQDARGNKTSYLYGQCAGGERTSTTNALNQTVSSSYDCNSGTMTSYTDLNNQPYSFTYDSLRRVTDMTLPDGGEKQFSYNDTLNQATEKVKQSASVWETTLIQLNSLGEVAESQLQSDPGGVTYTDYVYDGYGRLTSVSNPYRSKSESTYGLTSYSYDALGRKTQQLQGGAFQYWCYDNLKDPIANQPNCHGHIGSKSGRWEDFQDESGNQWQRTMDPFDRLVEVVEPNGTTASASLESDYTYDPLGNLTCVEQHGGVAGTGCSSSPSNDATSPWHVRRFTYDGLSRLVQAHNPESGWTCYGTTGGAAPNGSNCASDYDANGNLLAKTDGRGYTVNYTYDALNRKTSEVSITKVTFTHSFIYDQSAAVGVTFKNPNGNLTAETTWYNGSPLIVPGTTLYWNHDAMGRVLGTMTCTPASCNSTNIGLSAWYQLTNTYDLAGNMTSYSDGLGRTIASTYDGAGRPLSVTSSLNGAIPTTLWTANSYNAVGLTQATLGNKAVETLQYTNRLALQSSNIVNSSGQTLYSEALTYYPNLNVHTANDSVNGNWTYVNDTLNRLSTAVSSNNGEGCQFGYDSFGNRTSEAAYQGSCFSVNLSFNGGNSNRIDGYCYDLAGDLLDTSSCPPSGTKDQYYYDGFGNLLSPNYNKSDLSVYTVDAIGNRIAKYVGNVPPTQPTSQYLYRSDGKVVTEMSGSNWQHTNVYVGGQLLAELSAGGTTYLHSDHLGTIRAWSNSSGTSMGTCASLPFGEASNCTPPEYFYTGKERDAESGNDYFGARYYASTMGRFMSPDWSAKVDPVPYAKLDNPQSLNLYSYVWNNPLSRNDPDGHEVDLTNKDAKLRAETEKRILANVNKNERGLFTTSTDKNGKTSLVLNKEAAANFEGKHSAGFNMLTQAINSKSIASIEINDHPTMPDGHQINTGPDAGGGRTAPTGQGRNVNIYLSTGGDQSGVALYGYVNNQLAPIANPVGIIAGHELLGHGRLEMLGKPWGESEAVGVENQLRHEQGLPERAGGYN